MLLPLSVLFPALIGLSAGVFPLGQEPINFDCSEREGPVWWGCGSYGLCQGGQYSQVDCVNGTVYNRQDQQCSDPAFAPYPCSNPPLDCSLYVESPGHRIPDQQPDTYENRPPCSYYYTCAYGRFLGYQACPRDTVYDEGDQRCNEPASVPPPCGFGPERDEEGRGPGQLGGQGQGQGQNGLGGPGQIGGQGLFGGGRSGTQYGGGSGSPNQSGGPNQNQNPYGSSNQNSQYGRNSNGPQQQQQPQSGRRGQGSGGHGGGYGGSSSNSNNGYGNDILQERRKFYFHRRF